VTVTTRRKYASFTATMLLTALLWANAGQASVWLPWKGKVRIWEAGVYCTLQLTENCGAHAFAWHSYQDGQTKRLWNTIVASRQDRHASRIRAHEFKDLWWNQYEYYVHEDEQAFPDWQGACIAISNAPRKHCAWLLQNTQGLDDVWTARLNLTDRKHFWDDPQKVSVHGSVQNEPSHAIAAQSANNKDYVNIVYDDYDSEHDKTALLCAHSEDDGQTFVKDVVIRDYKSYYAVYHYASLARAGSNSATVYCVFHKEEYDEDGPVTDTIYFYKSTDGGATWDPEYKRRIAKSDADDEWWLNYPCVAAWGDLVLVTYSYNETGLASGWQLRCRTSMDGGNTWDDEEVITPLANWGSIEANCDIVQFGNGRALVTFRLTSEKEWHIYPMLWTGSHEFRDNNWQWRWYQGFVLDEIGDDFSYPFLTPQVVGHSSETGYATRLAGCVWTSPDKRTFLHRAAVDVYLRVFASKEGLVPDHSEAYASGRRLVPRADGALHYLTEQTGSVSAGPVEAFGLPIVVDAGDNAALAIDGDGYRWVAYVNQDTVWCLAADDVYLPVFCGSNSAVPGQTSIVCYPNPANGDYVANVVFAVYDTAGGASRIMYARADTSAVVLDTIESVANLKDSLPSVSVFKTDSILVTWQHGTDSVLSALLADYGPGTAGRPGAWSSPNLVTASGYHPMSVMDGSVLNCDWTGHSGNNYSIERSTNDLSGGMFGGWVAQTAPSTATAVEKANGVYAGVGCSVWQEKNQSDKWIIKAFVRGAETTLVDNDTDAYHPHAVAESSAISPSVNRIALHLLYDAGVAFEVDSGVFDTGEVRYSQFNFDVSHAGANATAQNNGSKLIRQGDSLFSVYGDLDGSIVYAWSASGDSWQRAIMATSRDNPAIAEDSTGKRWVVMHKAPVGMLNGAQEAYYRNGSSWTGPQTLYSAGATAPIGPASVAGASSTTSSIAYAAFLTTNMPNKSIVVAKFNGTTVSTYTLATGTTLGDPAIAVEPYKTDSDHVHVIWDDNGIVKYSMATDSRGSNIATTWTTPYVLTGNGVTGHHPIIGANRSRIVVAWAQGSSADIYSRKRATSDAYNNWNAAANLSNTANNASDWPTIAMGDTVVVAWEETRTPLDHDVMACIEFGDTLNVADNVTVSGYPHVVFQNKTSGDTLIPYLHSIWAETPEASYYEVRYNKLNLKHPEGEGQQSASSIPIPVKPLLASCMPNPFRNHTQINYALPTAGNVSLRVYDVTGRTVRTLASGHQRAGNYSVSWDARDSRGRQVPYGVYFYRLDTPGFRSVKKAVVTR
jgi:hypothetical protein